MKMVSKNIEKEIEKLILPKTKLLYEDFKLVAETSTYKVFNARARASREYHSIRVLDCTKDDTKANGAHAATLFIQELLWLQHRDPGSVFTNTFEISENGSQFACATLSYLPLSRQLDGTAEIINPKDFNTIEKLLSDVLSDVEFLWKDLQLRKILDTLGPENIYFIKEKERFFLGNWGKIYEKPQPTASNLSATSTYASETTKNKKVSAQDLAEEIQALAFAVLKMNKVNCDKLQDLLAAPILQIATYDFMMKSALKKSFPESEKLRGLIGRMLSLDFQNLPKLEELRVKKERTPHSSDPVFEESKQLQGETQISYPKKSSTKFSSILLDFR